MKGKCFIGKLRWHEVPNGQLPVFFLDTKGFGLGIFTGKDMPQYGLNLILGFYAYLLGRYKSANGYFEELVPIMQECVSVGLGISGELTMLNQEHIASKILLPYYNNW